MKNRVFKSIIIGGLLAGAVVAFAPNVPFAAITSVGKEAASATSSSHVSNPILRISIARGAAANTAFLAPGIDYGDVILQALQYDTTAANVDWVDITLDSLYWQDKTLDTLACGLATTPYLIILFIDRTD